MERSERIGSEYAARAGALTLSCIANPSEARTTLPEDELELVVHVLERWLRACPAAPLPLGPEARPALSALLDGWCSTVVHAVAARPLAIVEAAEAAGPLGEEAVARQIMALEDAGLLTALPDEEGETRFAPTEWLRLAIAPLAAAARLEQRHLEDETAPIAPLDVEAAFLLALPLVGLPEEVYSSCRLLVTVPGPPPERAGVAVLVEQGEITSVSPGLEMWSDTYATGSASAWLETLIDPSVAEVEVEGNLQVPIGLLEGLHETLFGDSVERTR